MEECVIKYKDNFYLKTEVGYKKIILTTDQDLIKDGVQAIDDDFLEWFVNNPSCEFVMTIPDVIGLRDVFQPTGKDLYKIIIPKEEPKQDRTCTNNCSVVCGECQILEPKQETLDNARREYVSDINCGFYSEQIVDTIKAFSSDAFEQGYKFAQEQNKELFSKEEVLEQLNLLYSMKNSLVDTFTDKNDYITMKWFEQFK